MNYQRTEAELDIQAYYLLEVLTKIAEKQREKGAQGDTVEVVLTLDQIRQIIKCPECSNSELLEHITLRTLPKISMMQRDVALGYLESAHCNSENGTFVARVAVKSHVPQGMEKSEEKEMTNEKARTIREGLAEELNFCSLEEIEIISKLVVRCLENWGKEVSLDLSEIQGLISEEQVIDLLRKAAMMIVKVNEDEGAFLMYPLFSILEYSRAQGKIYARINPSYEDMKAEASQYYGCWEE